MLVVELFCGKFGWSTGALELGAHAIGFDIEHLPHHGPVPVGAELVLQDVLTLRGRQFKYADLILASPPCQKYSWLAMPWSRSKSEHSKAAKALRRDWETNGPDNRLFNACFEIQKDACRAAGRYIPMVVENVRGAQEWVGPAKANFGSFYLWGDVAMVGKRIVTRAQFGYGLRPGAAQKHNPDGTNHPTGSWFRIADSSQGDRGQKVPGFRFDGSGRSFQTASVESSCVARFTTRDCGVEGKKQGGDWFREPGISAAGSRSSARKAASAQIAKIPLELSRFIAREFLTASSGPASVSNQPVSSGKPQSQIELQLVL